MPSSILYADDPAKGWRPWGVLVPFLGIFFVVITAAPFEFPMISLGFLDANENPVNLTGFALFLVLPFGALIAVTLAWTKFVERRPLATIGLTQPHALRTLLTGHLVGAAMMSAVVFGIWLMHGVAVGEWSPASASPAALGGIALLLLCFTIQSSAEEIVFRGWMMSAVAAKFGTIAGVIVSSLVFTLLHFDRHATLLFHINVVLFALFAATWSLASRSIWGVMGWHSAWNWLLGTGFALRVTGLDTHLPALIVKLTPTGPLWLHGGLEGAEASISCTIVLVCGILFQLWRRRRLVHT